LLNTFVPIGRPDVFSLCLNDDVYLFLLVFRTRWKDGNVNPFLLAPKFDGKLDVNILLVVTVFLDQTPSDALADMLLRCVFSENAIVDIATDFARWDKE
jgi:hypothetical protein